MLWKSTKVSNMHSANNRNLANPSDLPYNLNFKLLRVIIQVL